MLCCICPAHTLQTFLRLDPSSTLPVASFCVNSKDNRQSVSMPSLQLFLDIWLEVCYSVEFRHMYRHTHRDIHLHTDIGTHM